jgi:hypothetical protein
MDGDQCGAGILKAWSPTSITSCCKVEAWLEEVRTPVALVMDVFVDSLQNRTNRERHNMRQREGRRIEGRTRV